MPISPNPNIGFPSSCRTVLPNVANPQPIAARVIAFTRSLPVPDELSFAVFTIELHFAQLA